MRRREAIAVLAGTALWPLGAHAQQQPTAAQQTPAPRYVAAFDKMKRDYQKIVHPSEQQRADYISRLVRLRETAIRTMSYTWAAIDTEIAQHPTPADADGKALSAVFVGQWSSPRHDYLYRADGTWVMLPADPDSTHGTWRIAGNQYFSTIATEPPVTLQYTIILISKRDFVFIDTDKDNIVLYETRLK
jgi:hypothetical protein